MAIESVMNSASDLIAEVNKMQVSTLLKTFLYIYCDSENFQVELCQSSKRLEINVEAGRKKIGNDCNALIDRIRQSENLALKVLDQMAKRRRQEINKLNLEILTHFKPKLENLKQDMENLAQKGDECREELAQLAELENQLRNRISLQTMPLIESILIERSFTLTPQVFNIQSAVKATDIRLWYHPQNSTIDKIQVCNFSC